MRTLITRPVKWLLSRTRLGRQMVDSRQLAAYLERIGWFRSFREQLPIDGAGGALPWFTYPAIAFLEERIRPDMAVFEYGAGNSTLWWAARVASVASCEHDAEWLEFLRPKAPGNVEFLHHRLAPDGDYCRAIAAFEKRFDVVVIDGRERVDCAKNALGALKGDGVILWDDSDRSEYEEGYAFLIANGFRRLDFQGLAPASGDDSRTAVFYRDGNCFGI